MAANDVVEPKEVSEKWRRCEELARLYEVSDHGHVRRVRKARDHKQHVTGGFLTIRVGRTGSRSVIVHVDKKPRHLSVAKLVAQAFVPRPSLQHQWVEVIDGDHANIRPRNLRWLTWSEHRARYRIHKGSRSPNAKLHEDDVRRVHALVSEGWSDVRIGKRFKVSRTIIREIRLGLRWTHVAVELAVLPDRKLLQEQVERDQEHRNPQRQLARGGDDGADEGEDGDDEEDGHGNLWSMLDEDGHGD